MFQFLQGYKTYIFGISSILFALIGVWAGLMPMPTAAVTIMGGLTAMGMRGAIAQALRLLLEAQGIDLPAGQSIVKIRRAVQAVKNGARRVAPMFLVGFLAMFSLAGCATGGGGFFDNPQNDLQIAQNSFTALQTLYNTVCAVNADASYCGADNMKLANDLAEAVKGALATARLVIANEGSTDLQIQAAIQGARDAITKFGNVVNDLSTAKAKAMQAKAAARISLWDSFKHSLALMVMARSAA